MCPILKNCRPNPARTLSVNLPREWEKGSPTSNLRPSRGALLRRPKPALNNFLGNGKLPLREEFQRLDGRLLHNDIWCLFAGEDVSVVFNSPKFKDGGSTMVLQPRNASEPLGPKRLPECGSRENRSKGLTSYQIPTRSLSPGINILNGVSALAHERSRYCKMKCNGSCQCIVLYCIV